MRADKVSEKDGNAKLSPDRPAYSQASRTRTKDDNFRSVVLLRDMEGEDHEADAHSNAVPAAAGTA
jgi:hypothetical protein